MVLSAAFQLPWGVCTLEEASFIRVTRNEAYRKGIAFFFFFFFAIVF